MTSLCRSNTSSSRSSFRERSRQNSFSHCQPTIKRTESLRQKEIEMQIEKSARILASLMTATYKPIVLIQSTIRMFMYVVVCNFSVSFFLSYFLSFFFYLLLSYFLSLSPSFLFFIFIPFASSFFLSFFFFFFLSVSIYLSLSISISISVCLSPSLSLALLPS